MSITRQSINILFIWSATIVNLIWKIYIHFIELPINSKNDQKDNVYNDITLNEIDLNYTLELQCDD